MALEMTYTLTTTRPNGTVIGRVHGATLDEVRHEFNLRSLPTIVQRPKRWLAALTVDAEPFEDPSPLPQFVITLTVTEDADEDEPSLVGRPAMFTTWDGDVLSGVVERMDGDRPVIRFPDGRWATGSREDVGVASCPLHGAGCPTWALLGAEAVSA